jgi:hypothetical protein
MRARTAFLAGVLAFGVAGAASAADRLYTACNFWYEKPDRMYSTGYQRGALLPAGSEVKDVSRSSRKLEFTDVKQNIKFSVEFISKHHPGVSADQWIDRVLTPRDFAALTKGLTASEIKAIREGKVQAGMSKKAVLVSVGYPPEVGTTSTDSDTWKYWRDRFRNYVVQFSNGKVTSSGQ